MQAIRIFYLVGSAHCKHMPMQYCTVVLLWRPFIMQRSTTCSLNSLPYSVQCLINSCFTSFFWEEILSSPVSWYVLYLIMASVSWYVLYLIVASVSWHVLYLIVASVSWYVLYLIVASVSWYVLYLIVASVSWYVSYRDFAGDTQP